MFINNWVSWSQHVHGRYEKVFMCITVNSMRHMEKYLKFDVSTIKNGAASSKLLKIPKIFFPSGRDIRDSSMKQGSLGDSRNPSRRLPPTLK